MATPRQVKLIELLRENLGKVGERQNLGEILVEAGYSEATAKNPYIIMESETIQEGIEDLLKILDDKRRLSVTHISEDKLVKSSARNNAYVFDMLNKNHQLLSGKATENVKVSGYEEMTDDELDYELERRKNRVLENVGREGTENKE